MKRAIVPALALALALSACSPTPQPPDHFYRLQAAAPAQALAAPVLPGVLEVGRLRSEPLISGRPIAHRSDEPPHDLTEYHYHFWTESPTLMLRDEMVSFLRAANVAEKVVTPDLRLDVDYKLSGKLRRLEKIDGSPDKVLLEMEVALKPRRGGDLLMLETYRIEAESQGDGVSGAVLALQGAVNAVFAKLAADIAKVDASAKR